jgi:methionyl-tRNA formyltransferase
LTLPIVFAGTSEFAVPSLMGLLGAGHEIIAVYAQPDRPSGRGRKIVHSPVKRCAIAHQLPIFQPETFANEYSRLKEIAPRLIVVVAYGVILPHDILNLPTDGCINVHASLLPRWRGAAPIPRAIEAGDSYTGVTLMRMDDGLDTGDILFQSPSPIEDNDTAGSLHDRLAEVGAQALVTCLPNIVAGTIPSVGQREEDATYASKIARSERWLDWSRPATELARQIRAFNPKPLARTTLDDQIILVQQAALGPADQDEYPGTVLEARKRLIRVQAGDGSLELCKIQLPGGRPLSSRDFLNGFPLTPGQRFQSLDYAQS